MVNFFEKNLKVASSLHVRTFISKGNKGFFVIDMTENKTETKRTGEDFELFLNALLKPVIKSAPKVSYKNLWRINYQGGA